MEQLKKILGYVKKILASTKTTIVLSIIIIVLLPFCWERIVYDFECLAGYLYGTGADNKGKLLSTILTAIGGICVIWGLWLNNKKVAEQTRQNDISVQNSNDKRFGEAIGYLNDNNEGIVIGGVYALYQLAKEDSRYAPIITNIFYNYVNDNTDKQNKKSYQTILSLLFSKDNPFVFDGKTKFNGLKFANVILYIEALDIEMYKCTFNSVTIKGLGNICFSDCVIKQSTFADFDSLQFEKGEVMYCNILGKKIVRLYLMANNLFDITIIAEKIYELAFFVKLFHNTTVYSDTIHDLHILQIPQRDESSKLFIHYVSKIELKCTPINYECIEYVRDDAMMSDKRYRQIAGLEDMD